MKEFPKQFDFKEEDAIYKRWEASGFFNPDKIDSKDIYCNILPPPNANGELHVGHASGYAVMDIFGRYNRMKGKKVLLLPGKDHAGILTQVVYEKKIMQEKGIDRKTLGREKFYNEAYWFCLDRANYMRAQEKKLGISADWSREKFTLDKDVSKIVLETFVKMYEDGMIYKGKRIINWCPRCATALSDLEVIHQESDGKLYHIKYPIKDSDKFIEVATTRPETMLGDTAVAVNPSDKRYKNLIGKTVILPLQNKEIPVISDHKVDKEFGTGAVKITPAHDPLDWKIGQEHKLEITQVIDENAQITREGGKYAGQNVLDARTNIINDLKQLGLFVREEKAKINISVCERCKSVIEPIISKQWFVDVYAEKYPLRNRCLQAIKKDEIKFYPESFKKIMLQWFEKLDDWCISRQIWWGHRIPVWYRGEEIKASLEKPMGDGWIQDEDTFDTWFSSGQWVYSTLGYPNGQDFQLFYPTQMMIMGRDILFFWAARMIMLSLYRTGQVPFKNLYFTGLVLDKDGQKMSKSKNNGIDPMPMADKYGTDALRLSLISGAGPGLDFRLYEEKIAGFRNFVTKLWNIARYAIQSSENFSLSDKIDINEIRSLADKHIITELEETKTLVNGFFENKEISLAQESLRRFTWDQLADWYLEIHKIEKNSLVLGYILDQALRLWHPFMPFVTEKIWSVLKGDQDLLMVAKWPEINSELIDEATNDYFIDLQYIINQVRNLRARYKINPGVMINAYSAFPENRPIIEKMARVQFIPDKKAKSILIKGNYYSLYLDIGGLIDAELELRRNDMEMKNLDKLIKNAQKLVNNEQFLMKAPEHIRQRADDNLDELLKKLKFCLLKEKELNKLK
jgi:valyl-tRNA synthetase